MVELIKPGVDPFAASRRDIVDGAGLVVFIGRKESSRFSPFSIWEKRFRRLVAEIEAGTIELIPWEEVRAELFGPNEG